VSPVILDIVVIEDAVVVVIGFVAEEIFVEVFLVVRKDAYDLLVYQGVEVVVDAVEHILLDQPIGVVISRAIDVLDYEFRLGL
jgi:hypothetical protein